MFTKNGTVFNEFHEYVFVIQQKQEGLCKTCRQILDNISHGYSLVLVAFCRKKKIVYT
jgi:hypothetical protein